ncbi:MAG: helix-turn-helix domain-containing protein [Gemmatimonadetes bacterium]|nr:helix-turn-helix domain-containing protein [Gemmatimonadota bacterium]
MSASALARLLVDPRALAELPRERVPDALAEIERIRAALWAKLMTPEARAGRNGGEVDDYLTAAEIARRFSVSTKFVYAHRAELGGRKIGGAVRFPERAVRRYIEARRS